MLFDLDVLREIKMTIWPIMEKISAQQKSQQLVRKKFEESVNGKELKVIDDGQEEHGNSDADINTDEDEKSTSTSV